MMKLLDLTLPAPELNLACDEALLDSSERGGDEEVLRFWEPQEHFVVLGYSNPAATEVHLNACERRRIPVLRRCSGGGTVVQGPGCLNYALILAVADNGPLHSIPSANRFIMERNRAAIERLLRHTGGAPDAGRRPSPSTLNPQLSTASTTVSGHTDLALDGRKFSGNSQRRRRRYLLFHGTFLLHFDLPLIADLLPMPSRQPEYRGRRTHADFLINLPISADAIKAALRDAWQSVEPLETVPNESIELLARDKYATKEWNLKF